MEVSFRRAVARCPKCQEGTRRMWIGMFPGEPCPGCGEQLAYVDGDPDQATTAGKTDNLTDVGQIRQSEVRP